MTFGQDGGNWFAEDFVCLEVVDERWTAEAGIERSVADPTRASIDAMDGTQPGDPDKAASAILAALAAPQPPLRLALGEDAVSLIGAALERRHADLIRWQSVSLDTQLAR